MPCVTGRWVLALILFSATTLEGQTVATRVPPNASADAAGGWTCNDGFLKRSNACIAICQATDDEIRQLLIAQSIRSYAGSCPCPYNRDRAGRSCGRRSAYSRPGGRSPQCYPSDVSDEAVRQARERYRPRQKQVPDERMA
jgi:hypothetical protein